ncbi:hypothetical protein COT03_01205 [Candidatus Shapirobacteria bacterium CG07_land_8_20_14_0_80_39_18]|uniref:Nudix hydrolase domain-containing protein n=2 Tax=Microgenomates group TaxID=1794810 RepID=A0A2M6YRN2_9BACT|nr:MAG: hypothetical protein COT03_01205 [Candidatus Shapirobacteria bacterium CG07_land_8_20_14_0_80_39_18]PIY71057.1 MAG: hypothetical protein COY88_02360 [Candidatus Roizmanbacteria bacterium CG_4_10_14_0_8_um_filter_35_28]
MRTNIRVGAIIIKDKKILLIHRIKKGDEYWVVIGGGVEEGESLKDALKREVLEETCLPLLDYRLLGNAKDDKGSDHYFYFCKVCEGEPCLSGPEKEENCEDNWHNLEWVEIGKIGELKSLYPSQVNEFLKLI